MKKVSLFILCFFVLMSSQVFAQHMPFKLPNIPKQSFNPFNNNKVKTSSTIEAAINYNYMIPSVEGKRYHDTSIDIQGWNSISFLDIYWSWSFSNFINDPKLSNLGKSSKNYQYGILAPRLSLDKMIRRSLAFLIFKEWFISYRFEFDSPNAKSSNVLKHNIGIGVDLNIPIFDRFKTNIYARYTEKNNGMNNYSWNGYLFSVDYLITIYRFACGIGFSYEGWLDVIFGAKADKKREPMLADNSVMWKNTFKIDYKGFALGYTYQFNKNIGEVVSKNSDESQQSVGISYSVSF